MTEENLRTAIFISHANPEDNAFVKWLGSKLTALGYEVWADVIHFKGGTDWSRKLEDALRNKSRKMLLVCTPSGLDKQGVRNEIEMAATLSNKLNDHDFIIPLRLERYEPPFRIAQAQYIDFMKSWSTGLEELSELLAEIPGLVRKSDRSLQQWLDVQRVGATTLSSRMERLASNWLTFQSMPTRLYYCEPPAGFQLETFQTRSNHSWPVVPHKYGVLTFAKPNRQEMLGNNIPVKRVFEIKLKDFFSNGWPELEIRVFDASRIFTDLGNQAFEEMLNKLELAFTSNAAQRRLWYGSIKNTPKNMIRFSWKEINGLRQIIGQSEKRNIFWHYAISGQVKTQPIIHIKISASLVFSDNGMDALKDVKKAHRLRRSFAKSWRNARWRDMMLAFLWWISKGKEDLELRVAEHESLYLHLPPKSFMCPVSVIDSMSAPADDDDDDPDVDDDEWDDSFEYLESEPSAE